MKWWIVLPLLVSSANAQSLDFKGNMLGMDLQSFKKANNFGKTVIHGAVPNWRGYIDTKKNKEVPLPLCTNEEIDFPGSERAVVPGEVVCNASPWGWYQGKIVLDKPIDGVYHHFYNERLYAIELEFDHARFGEIIEAFMRKYGNPTEHGADTYQNVYGARWAGATVAWIRGKQAILASEGAAGGPERRLPEGMRLSRIVFIDSECAPPKEKPAIDF